MKLKKMCVFTISMLITFSLTLTSSFAAIDYTKQANREAQNAKVMSKTVKIAAYKSKTLSDKVDGLGLECTKITTSQQKKIAALGKSIIKEKYNVDDISGISDIEKLQAFHDWMTKTYYYRNYKSSIRANANPYKQYQQYKKNGKVAIWCNGYAAMYTALARSQGIATRIVRGHYIRQFRVVDNEMIADASWENEITERPATQLTHWWTQSFIKDEDGKYRSVMVDCNADSYNKYANGNYTADNRYITAGQYGNSCFDPTLEVFSRCHIVWKVAAGSTTAKGTKYSVSYK